MEVLGFEPRAGWQKLYTSSPFTLFLGRVLLCAQASLDYYPHTLAFPPSLRWQVAYYRTQLLVEKGVSQSTFAPVALKP
jgi:hypothetical protein